MKKIALITVLGIWLLCGALPVLRAAEDGTTDVAAETGLTGTPQEMAELQKTLGNERVDDLEQSVSDLKQTVSALTDRVADLERTVFDDNSRQ